MRKQPNAGTRLTSMILDHVCMCFLIALPMIAVIAYFSLKDDYTGSEPPTAFYVLFGALMCLYFFKDSFNGRSIAKRILKLQVVDDRTGRPASFGQCLVRNLFIPIWPIEVFVTLFRPQRRIGDLVAGTRVAAYDPSAVLKIEEELLSESAF